MTSPTAALRYLLPYLLVVASCLCSSAAFEHKHCEGRACALELGRMNCTTALRVFEFSGSCCSLQEIKVSGRWRCQLVVSSGYCDYAEKGYEQCLDDLEAEENNDADEHFCGTLHTITSAGGSACPASHFEIPDRVERFGKDSVVVVESQLQFQLDETKGRPPSDREMRFMLQQAKDFFRTDAQLPHFHLENIGLHFDFTKVQVTLAFVMVFSTEDVPDPAALHQLIQQAKLQEHIHQLIPDMDPMDHSYNHFWDTKHITFETNLA